MPKKLKLVTGVDNQILRTKSELVTKVPHDLIADMQYTLDENGVGLAAPQIGQNIRLFIMKFFLDEETYQFITAINPEIISYSMETEIDEEGCLSVPEVYKKIPRASHIMVKFFDEEMNPHTVEMHGYNARIFQHEYDHLEGTLFIDKC